MNLKLYIKDVRKDGKRYFTIEDVIKKFQISHSYARVALHRLIKIGDIISPARGLYIIVPPEHQHHGSIPPQELVPLVMRYLDANYYVALLSAGLLHGATHQKPARFQVISDKRIKHPSSFGDVEIDYIYKKSVLNLPTQDFTVATGYLKVATPENDPHIREAFVFRGGTALNKLFIEPPARYSEDIDFVQKRPDPIGQTIDAIRKLLKPWMGDPKWKITGRGAKLIYKYESANQIPAKLKIEINTTEHVLCPNLVKWLENNTYP